MEPKLIMVARADWEKYVEGETDAAYEKLDNMLDQIGLNGRLDVVAGMFYNENNDTIYANEAIMLAAFDEDPKAVGLTNHEMGHKKKVPKHDHPTGWRIVTHAISVGLDDRAGTRILRWFRHKPTLGYTKQWLKVKADDYHSGRLKIQRAADLKA